MPSKTKPAPAKATVNKEAGKKPAKEHLVPAASKGKTARRVEEASIPTVQPAIVRFFVADDMRAELNGKVTAVGLFADNVVVAEMLPGTADPSPDLFAVLPGVSILACVTIQPGEHRYKMEIDSDSIMPPVAEISAEMKLVTPGPGQSVNLIMRFAPLPITRFGMVRIVLRIDDQPYPFSFEIRRRDKSA